MIPEEINELLTQIVGRHAMNNGIHINLDFRALVVAVKYLVTQMPIAVRNGEQDDKDYAQTVLKETEKILLQEKH